MNILPMFDHLNPPLFNFTSQLESLFAAACHVLKQQLENTKISGSYKFIKGIKLYKTKSYY